MIYKTNFLWFILYIFFFHTVIFGDKLCGHTLISSILVCGIFCYIIRKKLAAFEILITDPPFLIMQGLGNPSLKPFCHLGNESVLNIVQGCISSVQNKTKWVLTIFETNSSLLHQSKIVLMYFADLATTWTKALSSLQTFFWSTNLADYPETSLLIALGNFHSAFLFPMKEAKIGFETIVKENIIGFLGLLLIFFHIYQRWKLRQTRNKKLFNRTFPTYIICQSHDISKYQAVVCYPCEKIYMLKDT